MRICVYCSSSSRAAEAYVRAARSLGRELAIRGHELVYGGGNIGLMGVVAHSAAEHGGRITGIIPTRLAAYDIVYSEADELIVTQTMSERKQLMIERAEAFIALPGGFGTLEELAEVITLKQLGYLDKALLLLNVEGFFDPLLAFFDTMFELEFAKPEYRALYKLAEQPAEALEIIEGYAAGQLPTKWF